ncbi:MAG: hypothetical protein Q6373_008640 [Candidatus Sigynarchaeota archaeon]
MAKKRPRQDAFKESVDELLDVGANLKAMEPPELRLATRGLTEVEGWWHAVRGTALLRAIGQYLAIMRRQEGIILDFLDIQSGPGMFVVTSTGGKNQYTFPGVSMLASWQASFGTEARFDHVYAFDVDPEYREAIHARLGLLSARLGSGGIAPPGFHVVKASARDETIDTGQAIDEIIKNIRDTHGKFYHYLGFIDTEGLGVKFSAIRALRDKLPYGDIIIDYDAAAVEDTLATPRGYKVLDGFFGTAVPRGDIALGLKELYIAQLKLVGFRSVDAISASPAGTPCKRELLFCSRVEKPAWAPMVVSLNDRLSCMTGEMIDGFWREAGRKAPTLLDMLEAVKGTTSSGGANETGDKGAGSGRVASADLDLALFQGKEGFVRPLLAGNDDSTWKGILSKNVFDVLKVNGDMVVVKKRISNTDLVPKSACIQGKIREKLGISALESRDIILLDRRSRQFGPASFPGDGRLDGTGFWLQLYKERLQDGNLVFLSKVVDAKKIVIIIDFFQQLYPIISFLRDYYQFYKEMRDSSGAFEFS